MPEKRIKIPAERVLFEVSKDGVAILDTTTEMKEMDGNTTALCDLSR
jgi:predicted RNA-binding protein